jgi:phosphoenolpyruvate carboxylase
MSLPALFRELKAAGVTEKQLQAVLNELEIEPVLTAHPTEAKRRAVLNQLVAAYAALGKSGRSSGGAVADGGNPRAKNRPAARGGHGAVLFQPHDF